MRLLPIALLLASGTAHADDPPFTIGSQPTWVILGGVTTGGTVTTDRGYFVGGELSLARLNEGNHIGVYTDAYYDWGPNGTYMTGGIELGKKIVDLDGGVAFRFADGQRDVGFTGRISLGIGVFSLYGRYMHFSTMTNDNVVQVGVLLKLPLGTFGGE
jgi:hypothetical protein